MTQPNTEEQISLAYPCPTTDVSQSTDDDEASEDLESAQVVVEATCARQCRQAEHREWWWWW
jgi:hypothetical protein